jgi:hypothetical protein
LARLFHEGWHYFGFHFIIPVAWFEKIFLMSVPGMLFIQSSLMPYHLPGFGIITQLIGNRNRRQILQIGKAANGFENIQYALCEIDFKFDRLAC